MVHSVPTTVTAPLAQQGVQLSASRLSLQKSTSEDSAGGEAVSLGERGGWGERERGRESASPHLPAPESEGGGARREQEESIQTCTKAIASLCIDSEESVAGRGDDVKEGGRAPSPDSSQQHSTSSPPHSSQPHQGPGIQHFSGLDLRPPYQSLSSSPSPHPPSPGPDAAPPPEQDRVSESTKRGSDAS